MLRFPRAIRLESLNLPIRKAIETAARLGAQAVQLDLVGELAPEQLSQTGRRDLRHRVHSHGMTFAALGFPTRHGYDVLERLEGRVAATLGAIDLAHQVGAPFIINHIGKIPQDRDDRASAHFFAAMDTIDREADRRGARFAIQTGLDDPKVLADFLKARGAQGLAVNYAPANMMVHGYDVYEGVITLGHSIVGVHVKDALRSSLNVSGVIEVPLGEGELDWPRLLGALEGIDYRGHLTIERDTGDQRVADISKGMDYLANLASR